jgi:RNA polymerase sigma-70 factor (ECF subfamily)
MDAVSHDSLVPLAAPEASWGEALGPAFAALAGGDVGSLEAVWGIAGRRLYAIALWRTGNEADARDVVQEVFVRLASRRHDLKGLARPDLWLMKVAHRAAVDLTRRRAVRASAPLGDAEFVAGPGSDPHRAAEAAQLSRALALLPAPQREAVSLRHLAGHTFREVAAITGVPIFTAASRCRLGLARLRQLLEKPS